MRTQTEIEYQQRLLRVLVHIQTHLDEAVSLEALAEIAHFSPFHFHRVFRGMVGEGVMEHVRRLRLERAAFQLLHSSDAVTSIAFGAGYETLDAFIRAFRTMFGVPPTVFRKRHYPYAPAVPPSGVVYRPDGTLGDFTPVQHGGWAMEAEVKHFKAMPVAFVRHTGPLESPSIGAAWGKLCAWAGPRGLLGPQTVMLGIGHDDPEVTPPERIRYDAGIILEREITPEGEIGMQTLPAGDYAVAVHRGPYENLKHTYVALIGQWIPQHGYRLGSLPAFEIYRNSPDRTKPENLITEVHVPVVKAE